MPHLRLETNVSKEKIPSTFARELITVMSKTLGEGKPEEVCAVTIVPDQMMNFGTTEAPCGQVRFMCIGKFSPKANIGYSKAISDKISELGIPSDRMFIHFLEVKSYEVGYMGTTCLEKENAKTRA